MLSFDDARIRVLSGIEPLPAERVPLESAVGRVLAEHVVAHRSLPGFDYSAMDGYAVCTEDFALSGGTSLMLVGESRTGGDLPAPVVAGTTCRIFTGARIPARANTVVMQERVDRDGHTVRFAEAPAPGAHIRHAGEDLAAGALVLEQGTRITPYHLGMLASVECVSLPVARRPVVAILATGDELRDVGQPERPGSVIDSNSPVLSALVESCGGIARRMPFCRDEPNALRTALRGALDRADLVLTVGGVSVGDHDLVRSAMTDAGVGLDFWKVAIKPGKPLAMGTGPLGQRVLGLPGNPASATLTFVLFGAPLVRALQGDRAPLAPVVSAVLSESVHHVTGRTEFVRAWLDERSSPASVRPLSNQSSGAVTSLAWANALVIAPSETGDLPRDTAVHCIRLGDV